MMAIQGQYFTDQEIRRIVVLLSETDMTIPEIAARMQCSRSAVTAINRKWKIRVYNGLKSRWRSMVTSEPN
jgi:hypothetical protein